MIDKINPKIFLIENVKGLSLDKEIHLNILNEFEKKII